VEIIISEVTNMSREICVAGWCPEEQRMVRPLSNIGRHWPKHLSETLFKVGNVINLNPAGTRNSRGMPHLRDDIIVVKQPELLRIIPENDIATSLANSESLTTSDIFEGFLQEKRYVMINSNCPSLGAVCVDRGTFDFYENNRYNKQLRCIFQDSTGQKYDMPCVGSNIRDKWDQGLQEVKDTYIGGGNAHVRIGLAHPMPNNGRAYSMTNGIVLY
jgi:hypothetical protein